jgi:hypothetical protein
MDMKAAMYWTKLKCLYLLQEEGIFFSKYFSSSTGSFPTTLWIWKSQMLRHPVFSLRPAHVQIWLISTKTFLTQKKEKLEEGSKKKLKKGGTASEAWYRHRRYSSTPPTIGGTVPSGLTSFPKRKGKF